MRRTENGHSGAAERASHETVAASAPIARPARNGHSRHLPHEGSHQNGNGSASRRSAALPGQVVAQAMETPVLRCLLPLEVGFSLEASGQEPAPALSAGEALLLYCTKGDGWCEIRGRRHRIRAGDLAVIPADAIDPGWDERSRGARPADSQTRYGTETAHRWTFYWVRITGANLDFFLTELGATAERPVLRVGGDTRLVSWFIELVEVVGSDCAAAKLIYASQTLAHLLSALICRQREHRRAENDAAQKIEHTIDYMRQHLDEPVRAATLAAVANMSLPHYFALFKRSIGGTPIDYFIKLRMEHARRLLAETSWSVKEVAATLGYEDPLYFSRVFKCVNRSTPSQYRLRHNGSNGGTNGTRRIANAEPLSRS